MSAVSTLHLPQSACDSPEACSDAVTASNKVKLSCGGCAATSMGACCPGSSEKEKKSCSGRDDQKDSCCSGGENETTGMGCGGEASCCSAGDGECTEEKDDSACMCCINVLVNEPSPRVSIGTHSSTFSDCLSNSDRAPLVATTYLEAYANTLRACCRALEKYCSRRPCCFVPHLTSSPSPSSSAPFSPLSPRSESSQAPQPEITKVKATTGASVDIRPGETLQLELRGMDCVDCVVKVERALAQLASVILINVDYFSGLAELQYDAEAITPAAIITYVARATGFGVKALTTSRSTAAAIVTLPLSFSTMPPPEALDGFDTRFGSNPHIIEVSFPVHIDSPYRPRDVLEQFKAFGAELVPVGSDGHRDMATHDLIVVGVRTFACVVLSIPVLVLAWANLPYRPVLYGSISVGLTTLIQGVAFPIISSACRSIVYLHQADMSVLVAISTLTAYVFSVVSYAFEVAGRPFSPPFFETSALLVTLIFLGRTISAATRRSTGSALRELRRLQPSGVILLSDEKEAQPQSLDSRLIYYGDIIRIPPETRIATDGLVVSGSSDADESSVTGESVAVPKQKGSRVIAGTLNLGGTLDVQVTQLVHENSLSRITALIKQAQSSRSPVQDLANKLSAIILPVAAFSACIAFLVWVIVGRYVQYYSITSSSVQALTYAIAILVVSCPCAIGLAIPMVISVAIRIAIREGVLFRSADALQSAHDIDVLVFDKTGTLTQGYLTTERVEILVEGAEQIVSALVKDNKHPISQGVRRYLDTHLSAATQYRGGIVTDIVSLPGKGIKASVCGFPLLGGSPTFTGACSHPLSTELQSSGLTLFTVTLAGQAIAFFGLVDTPRPEASALVVELTRRGKGVMIFSGDTTAAVHHLANTIGIPLDNAFAAYTPEDKDAAIIALQAKGQRVCFVGDGTNDGPALSRADVALAIAAGSDVALTAAGAVLLGSDLRRGVLALLDIAAAARMHAYWALAWCIFYNLFAILLASGAFIKVRIEPRWAGIGEMVSVLPVVAIGFWLDVRWAWRSRFGMRVYH